MIRGVTSRRFDETERSYEAGEATALPALDVGPVASVEGPVVHELTATYHDTDDLRLVRSRMTLRRREGGDDAGWHLKLPGGPGSKESRVELHRALGRSARAPVSVRRLVQGVTRGDALAPVVELVTRREEHRLLGDDGELLALVADDWVQATPLPDGDAPALAWREVEVELVDGGASVLAAVDKTLRKAGLRVSAQQSKLRRALADRLVDPAVRPGTAGDRLRDYLLAQRSALLTQDVLVRDGDPAGVHRLRVAARRLRSALVAYRPLLDRERSDPLAEQLRWLGRELSAARDLQVVDERLNAMLDDEDDGPVPTGPARRLLRQTVRADRREALAEVAGCLDSDRYLALLESLDALVADPCTGERADRSAKKQLRRRVRKTYTRLERRVAAVADATGDDRDLALHRVRKAAKRLRYTCEVAEPTAGKPARRLRRRAKRLQSTLGAHQDTLVMRDWLQQLVREPDAPASAIFALGRLHARLEADAPPLRRRAGARWRELSRRKAVDWLGD